MKKRLLSIFLSVCLLLLLLPLSAFAVDTGVQIGTTVLSDGVYYTVSSNNGFAIVQETDAASKGSDYLYYSVSGGIRTLMVHGDVVLDSAGPPVLSITDCTLTLSGDGNLSMTGGSVPTVYGVSANLVTSGYTGNLSFVSAGTVAVAGCENVTVETTGDLTVTGGGSAPALYASGNVTLKGHAVSLCGGYPMVCLDPGGTLSVTATGSDGLTLEGDSDSPLFGAGQTTFSAPNGDLSVVNSGNGMVSTGNVSASADGDITLESMGNMVVTGDLSIDEAKNATVSGAGSIPAIGGNADITAEGDISVTDTGSGASSMAVGGSLTAKSAGGSIYVTTSTTSDIPAVGGEANITAAKNIIISSAGSLDLNAATNNTLSAGGVVIRIIYAGDAARESGTATTGDGILLKSVFGDLNLTAGDHSKKTVAQDGYAWDGNTLTLGNFFVSGNVILPSGATVIDTTAYTVINGRINGNSDSAMYLTFTGTAPLCISGGIDGSGNNGDDVSIQDGAQITVDGSVFLGASGGRDGTLTVTGPETSLNVSSALSYGVMCDTLNVQNGASFTVGAISMGVLALTGVNVTGGSKLKAGCDYGVYIINGKLTVDSTSVLITNASIAPFCIVDGTSSKAQSNVLSLPGIPAGTEATSVIGTDSGYGYTYWSLVPTGGSLGVSDENNEPVTLTGAKTGLLTFAAPVVASVTVSPATASVQQGSTQTFSAAVSGQYDPSQAVTWSVSGNSSAGTAISADGKLTVADDETSAVLTVTATSTDDTGKYGTASVTVAGSGLSSSGNSSTTASGSTSETATSSGNSSIAASETGSGDSSAEQNPDTGSTSHTFPLASVAFASMTCGLTAAFFHRRKKRRK